MARVVTAFVAVPILLGIILLGPVWLFGVLVLICALAAYWELTAMARPLGLALLPMGYLAVASFVAAFVPGSPSFEATGLLLVIVIGSSAVATRAPSSGTFAEVAATVLGAVYVGALPGCILGLRASGPDVQGRHWIVFLLAVVMIGDAGAFYTGRSLGRHRLAPVLSPKKTIEGVVGGVASSLAVALALGRFLFPTLPLPVLAGLGILLALLGVLGDLFESLLKRSAGIKDTSSIIPGHGGVLDRLDSVLFAAPALYLYVRWTQ